MTTHHSPFPLCQQGIVKKRDILYPKTLSFSSGRHRVFHLTHEILLSPLNPPYKKELSSLLNFFTTFPNILIRDNIYKGAYVRTYLIRHELPPCDRLLLFQLASVLPTFFKNPSHISSFLELPPSPYT